MSQIRLRWGSYLHPDSEAAVSIGRNAVLNDQGQMWAINETWQINGRLEADTQVELTTKIKALEAAYEKQVSEISLEFSNTGADTAHVMRASDLIGGIQVTQPPSYPLGFGAEYSGFRNYQIQVSGLRKVGNALSNISEWSETIEVSGGWPRDILVTTINTPPVRQRIANATPCIVRQSGSAASSVGWPIQPAFILNIATYAVLLDDAVAKTTQGVPVSGTSHTTTMYRTSWSYSFAVPIRLQLPGTRRPATIPVSLT